MRWKIILSYLGTNYAGWQRQPGDLTVQQVLEESFSTILRQPIEIVGCGRTDTGVHARYYVAHFDADQFDSTKTIYHVNAILPADIGIHSLDPVSPEFHARYDATERMYKYYLNFEKDPFLQTTSYYFHQAHALNRHALMESAALLAQFDQFKPFCKTGSDADHYKCVMMESSWMVSDQHAVFTIRANRFLRGMVRLIVGATLNAAIDKITVDQIRKSLEEQTPMPHAWSVPAHGLFLEKVIYK